MIDRSVDPRLCLVVVMGAGTHVLGKIEGPYVAGKVVVPVPGDLTWPYWKERC